MDYGLSANLCTTVLKVCRLVQVPGQDIPEYAQQESTLRECKTVLSIDRHKV